MAYSCPVYSRSGRTQYLVVPVTAGRKRILFCPASLVNTYIAIYLLIPTAAACAKFQSNLSISCRKRDRACLCTSFRRPDTPISECRLSASPLAQSGVGSALRGNDIITHQSKHPHPGLPSKNNALVETTRLCSVLANCPPQAADISLCYI